MKPLQEWFRNPWLAGTLFVATVGIGVGVGLLLTSVATRKAEARFAYTTKADIAPDESRSEVWGRAYPLEYESWKQTSDTGFRSKFGGSAFRDVLAEDPRMVVLWAGYAFSKEYNQSRGHAYAVQDVRNILRTGAPNDTDKGPQPGTCWTCKSPDVPRMMAKMGDSAFYKGKWSDLGHQIVNPVGCLDCHDPKTMALRISRPALADAFARQGKDITKASHAEMRSLVCAQCHVEYYFNGPNKHLTFPWDSGMTVERMEAYYDSANFTDWVHALSKAPMLKAQHPDFEVFKMGIHGQRGLACADCHMPYKTQGGMKFSDHHIRSPLSNIANSCQVCHRESAEELTRNVNERQEKIQEERILLEDVLVRAHLEAKAAWEAGADSATMQPILKLIRRSQWRWDFATAGNGNAFHAPVEIGRILANGISFGQEARIRLARVLSDKGVKVDVPYPDISTKAKAQELIGLKMDKFGAEKQVFLAKVVPVWLQKAKAREDSLPK
ncbi:MAG TPA: ammonia-forming cytochrome c nitrite reductase [Fibrobacteria bacterium]|nr:ammonia-forming cytochrome c nitrite reductase [Fibrobacteria bacterium]HOX51686.1 ammonia-forming cytochrome c nitrite reductase [Fibrobacteria bacterium]